MPDLSKTVIIVNKELKLTVPVNKQIKEIVKASKAPENYDTTSRLLLKYATSVIIRNNETSKNN